MLVAERGLFIGERLRELRLEAGLTQEDLANEAPMSFVTISNLENNKQTAAARSLRKIARVLDVEVRDLTTSSSTARVYTRRSPEESGGNRKPRYPGGAETERDFEQGLDYEQELQSEGENGKEEGGETSEGRQT